MAYEKNTWARGDIVTSAKLNHMEDGIANAGETLVIGGFTYGEDGIAGTSDKTWQEIDNALATGARCVVVAARGDVGHAQIIITRTTFELGKYQVSNDDDFTIEATSADGYPTVDSNPIG